MDLGFVSVPSIVAICYFVGMLVKASEIPSKWIPIIVGGLGAVLGVAGLYLVPEVMAGADIYTAIAIGLASGLAATGANQVGQQLKSE